MCIYICTHIYVYPHMVFAPFHPCTSSFSLALSLSCSLSPTPRARAAKLVRTHTSARTNMYAHTHPHAQSPSTRVEEAACTHTHTHTHTPTHTHPHTHIVTRHMPTPHARTEPEQERGGIGGERHFRQRLHACALPRGRARRCAKDASLTLAPAPVRRG